MRHVAFSLVAVCLGTKAKEIFSMTQFPSLTFSFGVVSLRSRDLLFLSHCIELRAQSLSSATRFHCSGRYTYLKGPE